MKEQTALAVLAWTPIIIFVVFFGIAFVKVMMDAERQAYPKKKVN